MKLATFLASSSHPPTNTITKGKWCLKEGINFVYKADNGKLAPVMELTGIPTFYSCLTSTTDIHQATQDFKDPTTCFASLCRTITGQSISIASAQASWKRLCDVTGEKEVTPERILELVANKKNDSISDALLEAKLQKPVGLTRGKSKSIVDLAQHFITGQLSEDFLTTCTDDDEIRARLLEVKGIGPWSCDLFLIFHLERPNILPLGDLGVRKGIMQHYKIADFCPKKDKEMIYKRLKVYEPYHSLLAYYMWRAADTMYSSSSPKKKKKTETPPNKKESAKKRSVAKEEETKTSSPQRRRSVRRRLNP